jgi:Spy/CpxP family protein refolding chaperone
MSNTLIRRAVRATVTLSALALVSAAAGAQQVQKDPPQPPAGQGRGGPGGRGMQMLFEGITLTETQQKSVDSVRAAFREKMQGASQEDRRAVMQDQQKAIRGLLTPDQQKTYDANVEKMRAGRPGGAGTR